MDAWHYWFGTIKYVHKYIAIAIQISIYSIQKSKDLNGYKPIHHPKVTDYLATS